MMKQRLIHIFHKEQLEYQHANNVLSIDHPLQVLKYQLAKLKQTK